jgi:hypothetical protein
MSKPYFFRGVHLTDDELDGILMGAEASVFESVRNLHLKDCAECRAKLAEMREMLGVFREGVELWELPVAEATMRVALLRSTHNDRHKKYGWMIPAMGLAAMLAVGVMAPRWMHERRVAGTETASKHAVSAPVVASMDAKILPPPRKQEMAHAATQVPANDVLMQQVQQQLDEDVPSSMAPLTALIQTEDPHEAARRSKEN